MTDRELVDDMEETSIIGDGVKAKIKDLSALIEHIYSLMSIENKKQKVAAPPGVRDTNINDAINAYDTELSVLINIISKYINNIKKSCENIQRNNSKINKTSNSIDQFIDFDVQLTLVRDDIRDFFQKANKFDDDFNEYIRSNRVMDLDAVLSEIKKNHNLLAFFMKDKSIVFGTRTMGIIQMIERKIHDYAQKNKPF